MSEKTSDSAVKLVKEIQSKHYLYYALIIAVVLFALTKASLFIGFAVFVVVAIVVSDMVIGSEKHGWQSEVKEVAIALAVALIIWFGASFLLQTSAPLDAIVSCSMLPNMERGDMVILQGKTSVSAPEISLSQAQWDEIQQKKELEWICVYCNTTQGLTPCLYSPSTQTAKSVENQSGLVEYECGTCTRKFFDGRETYYPCTKSVTIAGQTAKANYSNDVIVYETLATDAFGKDNIIHRLYAKIVVEGKNYYLTKGDNNPWLDVQVGNSPPPDERVHGKVILGAPYIGYFKLYLFGRGATPPGCDSTLSEQPI